MKKWSKENIVKILDDAPKVSASLINEIYEALEDGGVDGVNILFSTRGTFNPKFKDRTEVIRFIVIIKQLAGTLLTPEENRVLKQGWK
jgi:hypothetical protein